MRTSEKGKDKAKIMTTFERVMESVLNEMNGREEGEMYGLLRTVAGEQAPVVLALCLLTDAVKKQTATLNRLLHEMKWPKPTTISRFHPFD